MAFIMICRSFVDWFGRAFAKSRKNFKISNRFTIWWCGQNARRCRFPTMTKPIFTALHSAQQHYCHMPFTISSVQCLPSVKWRDCVCSLLTNYGSNKCLWILWQKTTATTATLTIAIVAVTEQQNNEQGNVITSNEHHSTHVTIHTKLDWFTTDCQIVVQTFSS